ncbi:MAG: exosortase A [Sphingomonadales bacterium]
MNRVADEEGKTRSVHVVPDLVASWKLAILLTAVCLVTASVAYLETIGEMVATWMRSRSFNHAFLIFPISGYLIWGKRHQLAALSPTPCFWGLALLAIGALAWLVGNVAMVLSVQEFAFILIVQSLVLTVFGVRIAKILAFPLLYLFFAVPFGEFLVPRLQDFTAGFMSGSLQLLGIPVFHDGVFISIPTGSFEVAEACAGLRFLIATVALGFLFAHLTYTSLMRKIAFILLCLTVPVIANGLRALGIVLLAFFSNNRIAVDVDHIVYGWGFFAVITIILLLIGSRFSDKGEEPDTRAVTSAATVPSGGKTNWSMIVAGTLALAITISAPAFADILTNRAGAQFTQALAGPVQTGAWSLDRNQEIAWRPSFPGADQELLLRYRRGSDAVLFYVGAYARQRQGAELINQASTFAPTEAWRRAGGGVTGIIVDGQRLRARFVRLLGQGRGRVVVYWYWIGGTFTADPREAKLLHARVMLLGGRTAAAVVAVAADYYTVPDEAFGRIREFVGRTTGIAASLENSFKQ